MYSSHGRRRQNERTRRDNSAHQISSGRNPNNLRKISIFILNTVDLPPTRSMVAPAKRATKQRARSDFNDRMRLSIARCMRFVRDTPMLFVKKSLSVPLQGANKGCEREKNEASEFDWNSQDKSHWTSWTLQCTRKWFYAFVANLITLNAVSSQQHQFTLVCEWYLNNSRDFLHFAIWTLQRTRKWLYSFIANSIIIEPIQIKISFLSRVSDISIR